MSVRAAPLPRPRSRWYARASGARCAPSRSATSIRTSSTSSSRALQCTCRSCYLLFTATGAAARQASGGAGALPARPAVRARRPGLGLGRHPGEHGVPVRQLGRRASTVAFYPSPAGATESLLPRDGVGGAARRQPGVRRHRTRRRGAAASTRGPRPASRRSWCRSTSATSWSATCACTGRASTAAPEAWTVIDGFFDGLRSRSERGRSRVTELAFECVDVVPERYGAGADAAVQAPRHASTSGGADPRDRAALPDPDRAGAAAVHRRRGGAARRPVRRPRPGGATRSSRCSSRTPR